MSFLLSLQINDLHCRSLIWAPHPERVDVFFAKPSTLTVFTIDERSVAELGDGFIRGEVYPGVKEAPILAGG
jgi:hypothetical protein